MLVKQLHTLFHFCLPIIKFIDNSDWMQNSSRIEVIGMKLQTYKMNINKMYSGIVIIAEEKKKNQTMVQTKNQIY